MRLSEKKLTISLPEAMYKKISFAAEKNYQTITAFIRNCIAKEIIEEETLSSKELKLLDKSIKEFKTHSGKNWRDITNKKY
jgi:hypothetical protein